MKQSSKLNPVKMGTFIISAWFLTIIGCHMHPHSFVLVFHLIDPETLWAFLLTQILCGNGRPITILVPLFPNFSVGIDDYLQLKGQKGHWFCPRHFVQNHVLVSSYFCHALCHSLRRKKIVLNIYWVYANYLPQIFMGHS